MKIRIEFEQSEQKEVMDLCEEITTACGGSDLEVEVLKHKIESISKTGNLHSIGDPDHGVYEFTIGSKITNFIISKFRPIISAVKTLILLIISFVNEIEDVVDDEEVDTTVDGVSYYAFSSAFYKQRVDMYNDLAEKYASKAEDETNCKEEDTSDNEDK